MPLLLLLRSPAIAEPINSYFTLVWDGGFTTRRFRMQIEDASPFEYDKGTRYILTADGSTAAKTNNSIRTIAGIVRVGWAEDDPLFGTLAELRDAYADAHLRVKSWNDGGYWTAEWLGDFSPSVMDPGGMWFEVPIELEQVE